MFYTCTVLLNFCMQKFVPKLSRIFPYSFHYLNYYGIIDTPLFVAYPSFTQTVLLTQILSMDQLTSTIARKTFVLLKIITIKLGHLLLIIICFRSTAPHCY